MRIIGKSSGVRTSVQNAGLKQGGWSGGKQLFVQAETKGDYVELEIPANDNAPRKVILYGTKSYDYAILRFRIDGQPAGEDFDAYSAESVASGPIELGTFTPKDDKLILRVEIAGSNPAARGSGKYFGLDCVVLQKP